MKTKITGSICLTAIVLSMAMNLRAEAASTQERLKRRESILVEIVGELESRRMRGIADEEAVIAAQVDLYKFRRDTSTSPNEKLANQRKIVAVLDSVAAKFVSELESGTGDKLKALRALNAAREADQQLDELKARNPKSA